VIVGYALSWYAHSWYSHGIDAEVVARNRERHQEERLEEIITKMLDDQKAAAGKSANDGCCYRI
jgi:hypothetical protein